MKITDKNNPSNSPTTHTSPTSTITVAFQNPTQSSQNPNACAACRFQRRKCDESCLLAPYFPSHKHQQFINAYKLYGVNKIIKVLKTVAPNLRDDAMTSLIYSANARAQNPVGGCKHIIDSLNSKIALYNHQLNDVLAQIAAFRAASRGGVPPPFISAFGQGQLTPLAYFRSKGGVGNAEHKQPSHVIKVEHQLQSELHESLLEDIKPFADLSNEAMTANQSVSENTDYDQAQNVTLLRHNKLEGTNENREPRTDEQKSSKRKFEAKLEPKNKRIKQFSFETYDDITYYNTFPYPN